MNYKTSRTAMWIGYLLGLFIMALGIGAENEKLTFFSTVGGVVTVAVSLIQALIFYRCPECGYSLLNVRGKLPKFCPECKHSFSD